MDLFDAQERDIPAEAEPLAARMRPRTLDEFQGQRHILGEGRLLSRAIASDRIGSLILWGPPGSGKTTLAEVIARATHSRFERISAVMANVEILRKAIYAARNRLREKGEKTTLFIDEIHRFNKSQQDSLLGAVEQGILTLIGATTENPSFEVISPLLSRCQVYVLKPLDDETLRKLIDRAVTDDYYLSRYKIRVAEYEALIRISGGDARKLYNALELTVSLEAEKGSGEIVVTDEMVLGHVQQNLAMYDKNGEQHYDIISAFIKSLRGSDPNAAVYWLARMVEGGEDVKFIARRMVILAAEDIGLANPNALLLAQACFNAVNLVGWPESRIILSEAAVYLATSPKSNASYMAIENAIAAVRQHGDLPVPLHLRNAPTRLMKNLGYHEGYRYAHSFEDNFVQDNFLPEQITGTVFYDPGRNARELEIRKQL